MQLITAPQPILKTKLHCSALHQQGKSANQYTFKVYGNAVYFLIASGWFDIN